MWITDIKETYKLEKCDIRHRGSFSDKLEQKNSILEVDKDFLIDKKRILIDLVRVNVAPYVRVIRCFKCRRFGHYANKRTRDQCCANCSGHRATASCASTTLKCSNCKEDNERSANSNRCPSFQKYKEKLFNSFSSGNTQ